MPIIACGISHHTAPVSLRERVVFAQDRLSLWLQDLAASENVTEAVLLSTCNRSELYCDIADATRATDWFSRQHGVAPDELANAIYMHEGLTAVRHIMHVACGLDSMVLGESQVLGQMKTAFSESCAAGMVGPQFNRLFQQVFAVAKEVRSNTDIGACPVSVSSAAVKFVSAHHADIANKNILLIGAGLTVELMLRHLAPLIPVNQIMLTSRNFASVNTLAEKFSVCPLKFDRLSEALKTTDILMTATGSLQPVVTPEMLSIRTKPIFIMDIAVPRDVDPAVKNLAHVSLHSIDDLRHIIQQGVKGREHAAEKAQEIIEQRSQDFMNWLQSIDLVTATIRAWRQHMETLCEAELNKSLRKLQRGEDPAEVLNLFSRALMQKILHTPSAQLREAGISGRLDLLELARELFAISDLQPAS